MSSFDHHHKRYEKLAEHARSAIGQGNYHVAARCYRLAAECEVRALRFINRKANPRTWWIVEVSAAWCKLKAGEYDDAEKLAVAALGCGTLPAWAKQDMGAVLRCARKGLSTLEAGLTRRSRATTIPKPEWRNRQTRGT